jgi:chemotaxis-related protein WspB
VPTISGPELFASPTNVLFLLVKTGSDTYALDVKEIAHVLALVHVAPLANSPPGLAGVFNYRGTLVPVVDLAALRARQSAGAPFSRRVILVNYPHESTTRLVGLVVEQATDVMRRPATDFVQSGIGSTGTARGCVVDKRYGVVQWIDAPALLTRDVRDGLFADAVAM